MLLWSGLFGFAYYFNLVQMMVAVIIVTFFILLTRYISMKKKRFGYNDEMLVIHGGAFGDKTTVLPIYKIQAFDKNSTPYQRRKGLVSLTLHTASGRVKIPYVEQEIIEYMTNELLYKVEKDKRPWM